MNCKFCNAELPEDVTLCPACGQENAEETIETEETVVNEAAEAAELPVEAAEVVAEPAEVPAAEPKKNAPKWLVALAIVGVLAIAAVLGTAVFFGIKSAGPVADSYTVSDSKAIKERDTVVAEVGDVKLTNSALQVYYWEAINDFQSNYGQYLSGIAIDLTKPLDEQFYDEENGVTWQKFFLDSAITAWSRYAALNMEAKNAGFELSADMQEYVESLPQQMQDMAADYGYEDVADMLNDDMGAACDETGYLEYLETNILGSQYMDSMYESLIPTQEEIEDYYTKNEATLSAQGITKDSGVTVDVRHILICPENGITDSSGNATYTVGAWEDCRVKAQALLDQWAEESGTEEGFAQFATEHTEDPGSQSTGGLYTDVYVGQMVEPFEEWCFDESRVYGDTGLVQTSYGYHLMYFVESREIWISETREAMIYERSLNAVNEAAANWPAKIYNGKIVLSEIVLQEAE